MRAAIPAADLTAAGTASITVQNPAPGGVSEALPLTITMPLPVLGLPSQVAFPAIWIFNSSIQRLTLTNNGPGAVHVSNLAITGDYTLKNSYTKIPAHC